MIYAINEMLFLLRGFICVIVLLISIILLFFTRKKRIAKIINISVTLFCVIAIVFGVVNSYYLKPYSEKANISETAVEKFLLDLEQNNYNMDVPFPLHNAPFPENEMLDSASINDNIFSEIFFGESSSGSSISIKREKLDLQVAALSFSRNVPIAEQDLEKTIIVEKGDYKIVILPVKYISNGMFNLGEGYANYTKCEVVLQYREYVYSFGESSFTKDQYILKAIQRCEMFAQ